jgi:hypothetical protein
MGTSPALACMDMCASSQTNGLSRRALVPAMTAGSMCLLAAQVITQASGEVLKRILQGTLVTCFQS